MQLWQLELYKAVCGTIPTFEFTPAFHFSLQTKPDLMYSVLCLLDCWSVYIHCTLHQISAKQSAKARLSKLLLSADWDEFPHLVCCGTAYHGRLIRAQHGESLQKRLAMNFLPRYHKISWFSPTGRFQRKPHLEFPLSHASPCEGLLFDLPWPWPIPLAPPAFRLSILSEVWLLNFLR